MSKSRIQRELDREDQRMLFSVGCVIGTFFLIGVVVALTAHDGTMLAAAATFVVAYLVYTVSRVVACKIWPDETEDEE